MKHIYKILLILILIITIAIYFYTNRYETHAFDADEATTIVIINKWTGETLVCGQCRIGKQNEWVNYGTPIN